MSTSPARPSRRRALLGPAAVALAAGAALAAGPPPPPRSGPATLAVVYRSTRDLARAARAAHATVLRRLPALAIAEVRAPDRAAVDRLARTPGIRLAGRPRQRGALAEPGLSPALAGTSGGGEWEFGATHEDEVPAAVLRAAAAITIAVVDTGADLSAPDLAAKHPLAYDVRGDGGAGRDTSGHGTFVASLAAGSVRDGEGIAGFGGDARLLVVRCAGPDGTCTDVDEAAGIVYAVRHGARIVDLSLGGSTTSPTERRAIAYAVGRGALVVAAAGNEFAQGSPVQYPAALLQPVGSDGGAGAGLAVAASTMEGTRAPFSSVGSWISLAAPGEHVLGDVSTLSSPLAYPRTPLPGSHAGLYGYASGTSFAAPQVAGAAALVWAADPDLDAPGVARILEETASGGGRWTPGLGYGVLDVGAAVARALADARGLLESR